MRWTLTQTGLAAPDVVWQRYADLDAWSQWAPLISGVEADSRELIGGLSGTVRAVGGLRVQFAVLDVDDATRSWTWRATVGFVHMTLRHGVLSDPDGRTRAVLDLDGAPPVVIGYLLPATLALRSLVRP